MTRTKVFFWWGLKILRKAHVYVYCLHIALYIGLYEFFGAGVSLGPGDMNKNTLLNIKSITQG